MKDENEIDAGKATDRQAVLAELGRQEIGIERFDSGVRDAIQQMETLALRATEPA